MVLVPLRGELDGEPLLGGAGPEPVALARLDPLGYWWHETTQQVVPGHVSDGPPSRMVGWRWSLVRPSFSGAVGFAAVTPPPAPLPVAGSWLEQQWQKIQDAVATGKDAVAAGQAQGAQLRSQLTHLPATLERTAADVQQAAQLKQLLPVVVALIGIVSGRALLGLGAGALLWWLGQPRPQ